MNKCNQSRPVDGSPWIATFASGNFHDAGKKLVEIVPVKTMTVPPYTTTNAIFFGNQAFWVIDPGTPDDDQRQLLRNYIEKRHKEGHQFLGVCLTHHHGDHSKAAQYLAEHFSVPILAHQNAVPHLKFPVRPMADREMLAYGQEPPLSIIYTPGHADDHVVYYQRDHGLLIAGDMITDRGTILIPPVGGSLKIYLDSLNALTLLPLTAIIPAHGDIIVEAPNAFLIKAMKHRYERIAAVLATIKNQDALDATDITRLVYRDSIAENLLVFAQLSVESSLYWLKDLGLVENHRHRWQIATNAPNIEQEALSHRLKEIDERLRNT